MQAKNRRRPGDEPGAVPPNGVGKTQAPGNGDGRGKAHGEDRGNGRSRVVSGPERTKRSNDRVRRLFEALRVDGSSTVPWSALPSALQAAGLRLDDPRLRESIDVLRRLDTRAPLDPERITYEQFVDVVTPNILLIEPALQGSLVIPDFASFCTDVKSIYENVKKNMRGRVADYIPQLGRVDPERFAVALTTTDGQRFGVGDAGVHFCLQSTCKPLSYCMALEEHGEEHVHRHVGREPSGRSFNELSLNSRGLPHNPMINAGAIMSTALIKPNLPAADRFDHVVDVWTRACGGERPGFSNSTYLSERETADRNFALGYFMREKHAFPDDVDLVATLEFFFQCCSMEITPQAMSVMAGTLANGGICPTTGHRVFSADTVQKCLSLMYSCGMYDFSGEWAFSVGLPAKSGVSGAILIVVPNVMGIAVWSPRLDDLGNSVRGIEFGRELVRRFNFHNYDNLTGGVHDKQDPRRQRNETHSEHLVALCWAASQGDLNGIRRLVVRGVDLNAGDYDGRTALHLAASEGHVNVVRYFLSQGVELDPRDRWGGTPLDDAHREGHENVVALLQESGASRGSASTATTASGSTAPGRASTRPSTARS